MELLQSLLDASRLVPPPSLLGAALAKAAEAKQRGTTRCSAENHGEIMGKIREHSGKSWGNMIDMENHGNIMVEAMDKILGNYGKPSETIFRELWKNHMKNYRKLSMMDDYK